jgi:hypothetical protein
MTNRKRRGAGDSAPEVPAFAPVKLRYRRDGLTPERQVAVVQGVAECGCMREACARVGISTESVYRLLRRPDAQSFRIAIDLAFDGAVERVEDGAFSRALNGVEIPHYYKGELVGTHRRHDERLTMFILRYRKPHRYGRHLDRRPATRHPEASALGLAEALAWVESDAHRDAAGLRRAVSTRLAREKKGETWDDTHLYRWGPAAGAAQEPREGDADDAFDDLDDDDPGPVEGSFSPDVSSTSSTSAPRRNRRARRAAAAKGRKR